MSQYSPHLSYPEYSDDQAQEFTLTYCGFNLSTGLNPHSDGPHPTSDVLVL